MQDFTLKESKNHIGKKEKFELVFIHPQLIKKLEEDGHKLKAKKFYIKPLSDEPDCEVGFVTGITSPLRNASNFAATNAIDTVDQSPAWTNREDNNSLDNLLNSIINYLSLVSSDKGKDVVSNTSETFREGKSKDIIQTEYERNPHARIACLKHHGYSCQICDFNFETCFGELGKGFIHVHHINPIAEIGEEYEIDPKKDLVPVCPNCHAMINSRRPPFTIEEIKDIRKPNYNKGLGVPGAGRF